MTTTDANVPLNTPAGWFQIRVAKTDLNDPNKVTYYPYVVAVENNSTTAGTRVVLARPKAGELGQLWKYTWDNRLINGLGANLVLAIGNDTTDGKEVVVADQISPPGDDQRWTYSGTGNPFSLLNMSNNYIFVPQPGSEPAEGVPLVAANLGVYNEWSFWYASPAAQMTYVLRNSPVPFPEFTGEEALAYDAINTNLGLSAPLRSLYTETNRPWETWQSEINAMSEPPGVGPEAWSKVQSQLNTELTAVQTFQQTIRDWKDFTTEFMVDKEALLDALGTAAGMEVGSSTSIGGSVLAFFTGLLYTALETEPELAALGNLFQTGVNVAQSFGDTSLTPDPFQVAYYELWERLSKGFEDMLAGIDHMGVRMLTDWGAMQAAMRLINDRGPDTLAWRVAEDSRMLQAGRRGFIINSMQMLLPAKYMIYKYPDDNDSPVSGVPDYAQWIEKVGDTWFKYWIADGTNWGVYPSSEAMQSNVWDQGVVRSDFFKCRKGWAFATSYTDYYRGLTEAGMAVMLVNQTTNLLLARLDGVENGEPKAIEYQTIPPGQSIIMACLGTATFSGPTMALSLIDPSVTALPIQTYSAHQKVPVFTGADLTVDVTVPHDSFGYRTATPICWPSAQNATWPSTSGAVLNVYRI